MTKSIVTGNFTSLIQQAVTKKTPVHNINWDKVSGVSSSQNSSAEFDYFTKMFARDDVQDNAGKNIQKKMAAAYEQKDDLSFSKSCLEFAQYFYDKGDVTNAQEYVSASSRVDIAPKEAAINLATQAGKADGTTNRKQFAKLLRREAGNILHAEGNLQKEAGNLLSSKDFHRSATRHYFRAFGGENFKEETLSLSTDFSEKADYKKFIQSLYESTGYKKVVTYCDHALSQLPDDTYFSHYRGLAHLKLNAVTTGITDNADLSRNFQHGLANFNQRLSEDFNKGRYKKVISSARGILEDQNLQDGDHIKHAKFLLGRAYNRLQRFDEANQVLADIATEEKFAPIIFFEVGKAALKTGQKNKAYNYYDLFVTNSNTIDDQERSPIINEISRDITSKKVVVTAENFDLLNHLNRDQHTSDGFKHRLKLPVGYKHLENANKFVKEGNKEKALNELNEINLSKINNPSLLRQTAFAYTSLNFEKALLFYDKLEQLGHTSREFFEHKGDIYFALCLKNPESIKDPNSINTLSSFKDSETVEEQCKKAFESYQKAVAAERGNQDLGLLQKTIRLADHLQIDSEPYKNHRDKIDPQNNSQGTHTNPLFFVVGLGTLCMICDLLSPRNHPHNPNANSLTANTNRRHL